MGLSRDRVVQEPLRGARPHRAPGALGVAANDESSGGGRVDGGGR